MGSFTKAHLEMKDIDRVKKAWYKATEASKKLRRNARRRRKGLLDKQKSNEGVMYAAGAFYCDDPFDDNLLDSEDVRPLMWQTRTIRHCSSFLSKFQEKNQGIMTKTKMYKCPGDPIHISYLIPDTPLSP